MILWTDASDFHQMKKGYIGFVFSDISNTITHEHCDEILYDKETTIVSLEYEALINGLQYGLENNYSIKSINIDNLTIFKHLSHIFSFKDKKKNKKYNLLKERVLSLLKEYDLSVYDICVINRENNLAHVLAYSSQKTVV